MRTAETELRTPYGGHGTKERPPVNTMLEEMLLADEVARALRVTRARVYELARSRLLPCIRVGRQVRFTREALNQFIRAGGQSLPGSPRHSDF